MRFLINFFDSEGCDHLKCRNNNDDINNDVVDVQLSERSMQLLVCLQFCLAVCFPSGDKAAETGQTAGRLKGH